MMKNATFYENSVELKIIPRVKVLTSNQTSLNVGEEYNVILLLCDKMFMHNLLVVSYDNKVECINIESVDFVFDAVTMLSIYKKVKPFNFEMFLGKCLFTIEGAKEELVKFAFLAKKELDKKVSNKLFDTLAEFELPKISLGDLKPEQLSSLFKFLKWKCIKTNKDKELYQLSYYSPEVGRKDFYECLVVKGETLYTVDFEKIYYAVNFFSGPNARKENLFLKLIK